MIEKSYPPNLPSWISDGGENFEVVISTEALYVRNLADRPFPNTLDREEREISRRQMTEILGRILPDYRFLETDRMEEQDRKYLAERGSLPEELLPRPQGTGLFLTEIENSWVALNTSDHLRFRFVMPGTDVETVYRKARDLEEKMEQSLPFAYSERFGFLTSRPTECGTGLMIGFIVHIPGIVYSNNFSKLRDSLLKAGLTLKPFADPSISSEGHLFWIRSAHTLGLDEEEILETSRDMIYELVEMEFKARDAIMSKARYQVEDKILRGIGILTHARMIARQEGYALANALRLDAAEGITLDAIDLISATELFLVGKPAHLTAIVGEGNQLQMDTNRAELFRDYLKIEG